MASLFPAIHQVVGDLLYADNFSISLYDREHKRITFPFVVGRVSGGRPRPNEWHSYAPRHTRSRTAYVIRTRRPQHFTTERMQRLEADGKIEPVGRDPVESLGAPIIADGHPMGVVEVQSFRKDRRYARQDLQLLRFAGQQLGAALTRLSAIEEIRQRNAELALVSEIGSALAKQLDFGAVIEVELSRFLSPQIASLVSSPDGEQLLSGHRRQITAAFCDLRGFTSFAEQADPEELFGVLAEYHRMMGAAITEHGGTLEHFAGDGVMIFFNDPVPQEDHVERAVRMAIDMRDRFGVLADGWRKRGYELGFGVGIATGYATLGRIGFEGRYDYGAIGNVVILASRLSGQAGEGQILLSQRAHAMVEGLVDVESVGDLTLKGFSRPVPASNVVGVH